MSQKLAEFGFPAPDPGRLQFYFFMNYDDLLRQS
jgi:hypothetical protein